MLDQMFLGFYLGIYTLEHFKWNKIKDYIINVYNEN